MYIAFITISNITISRLDLIHLSKAIYFLPNARHRLKRISSPHLGSGQLCALDPLGPAGSPAGKICWILLFWSGLPRGLPKKFRLRTLSWVYDRN